MQTLETLVFDDLCCINVLPFSFFVQAVFTPEELDSRKRLLNIEVCISGLFALILIA